jgi:hypothetical protein
LDPPYSLPFSLSPSFADDVLESFSLRVWRTERKRWKNVLAVFAGVGSVQILGLESARKPAQTPTAKRNGTGRSVPSGTGRTRSISGQTICRRNWTLLASVKGLLGFVLCGVALHQDYPRGKFKR